MKAHFPEFIHRLIRSGSVGPTHQPPAVSMASVQPTAPLPPPPPHHHGPGVGWSLFGLVAWLVEMQSAVGAVMAPFADCHNWVDVLCLCRDMPNATFAGVAFWFVSAASSTVALVMFLMGKFRR